MSTQQELVADRYLLVRRIGSGAMGIVWEAHDERLNRTVAVKQLLIQPSLDPGEADEAVQRTMREGRIAARLHHPNAVSVFDVVDSDGAPCLVMEYLPSRSLADVLNERGSLPPENVATIGAQVASALAAAHAAGIVHRDIKPGNVLLGDNGVVKITDFGISRATDDVTVTKTGLIAGTPAYLAPEVAVGKDPNPAADVFSLGSTLYAAVEGQPPFGQSENTLGLLHAVAAGRIVPPEHAGPLTPVLTTLLQADPDDRPDARGALHMLRSVSQGETPQVPVMAADPTRAFGGTATVAAAPGTRALPSEAPPAEEVDYERPASRSKRGIVIGSIVAALIIIAAILYATGLLTGGTGGNTGRQDRNPNPVVPPVTSSSQVTQTQNPVPNPNPNPNQSQDQNGNRDRTTTANRNGSGGGGSQGTTRSRPTHRATSTTTTTHTQPPPTNPQGPTGKPSADQNPNPPSNKNVPPSGQNQP